MRVLIYERAGRVGAGARDVAGRPLLLRQLQILREQGLEDVVVEVCDGPHATRRAQWLLGTDPLTFKVTVVPSSFPLGAHELARRAGLTRDELFVALAADVIAHPSNPLPRCPGRYALTAPAGVHLPDAELCVESVAQAQPGGLEPLAGWGVRIESDGAAHELGCAALTGLSPGLVIHAAQIKPGVWLARGATLAGDALVHPPVLLGVDALVLSRAQVGPRAIVGDRAVVERDALIADSAVAEDTIVGEGTLVKQALADAQGMTSLADATHTPVQDTLVLSPRRARHTSWSARTVALVLLVLLSVPWLVGVLAARASGKPCVQRIATRRASLRVGTLGIRWLDALPALLDALQNRRDLVGVSDRRALEIAFSRTEQHSLRAGAIDISRALAPGASTSTLLRMWRWYQTHKTARLDRHLWSGKSTP